MRPDPDRLLQETRAIFARYPRFEAPRACTHCISEDEQRALQPLPLESFPQRELWRLIFNSGVGTWGGEDDFKHLLPRAIELLLEEPPVFDLRTLVAALLYWRWRDWPDAERDALERALEAAFWREVERDLEEPSICAQGLAEAIRELSRAWGELPSFIHDWPFTRDRQTLELLYYSWTELRQWRLDEWAQPFLDWLSSEPMKESLLSLPVPEESGEDLAWILPAWRREL